MPLYRTNGVQQQCGYALGVLCAEDIPAGGPGHLNHAETFDYPVLYARVKGLRLHDNAITGEHSPVLLDNLIDSARALEAAGVKAIIGNCSSILHLQGPLKETVDVPVALSSLLQCPLVAAATGYGTSIGVIGSVHHTDVQAYLERMACEPNELAANYAVLSTNNGYHEATDANSLRQQLDSAVCRILEADSQTGAILLDGTELAAHASYIQEKLGLPVFDMTTLADYLISSTRHPCHRGWV